MAPSPPDALYSQAVQDYGASWRAIMHLVRSGYSWSGHERNCVFLNMGNSVGGPNASPRFAQAAAVSGLDLPDDGRGLAVVDWDGDGDLDLWLRNRSAPRLRLMRNQTEVMAADDVSVSLHLVGSTCNRDAIGARAELTYVLPDASSQRLVRSVRAGDVFLSQSSKWLHFGLPREAQVTQLTVSWPGGPSESIPGIVAGTRYEIQQGTAQAVVLPVRPAAVLTAQPNLPLPPTAAARVILPGRIALPHLPLRSSESAETVSFQPGTSPTLVIFWLSSCPNCRRELAEMAERRAEFNAANLKVMAVCVDGLNSTNAADSSSAETSEAADFLQAIEFPFETAAATSETTEILRQFQNALFSQYPEFVVPFSLLVDANGRVVCLYRGSYSHQTFLQDCDLLDLDEATLRSQATPLAGTWITKPATTTQFAELVGGRMLDAAPKAALQYFEIAAKAESNPARQAALRAKIDAIKSSIGP